MSERYNGYRNRQTWAVALYIANDEGLSDWFRDKSADEIKDQWEQWVDDLIDNPMELTRDMRMMLIDIGDLGLVDWYEVESHCKSEDEANE